MDGSGHYLSAALEQTPSAGVGLMEFRDGTGPVVCTECRQSLFGPGAGAQGEYGTATGARGLV